MKVAWAITGAGDKIHETLATLYEVSEQYEGRVDFDVYLSKAGQQVVQYYGIKDDIANSFEVYIEKDANTPFLAGKLQTGAYVFLLIAPATSNTVAKIVHGIGDTMITNGAIQAMKSYTPIYVMPTDYRTGETTTTLPNGRTMRLRVRKEDAHHVNILEEMDGITPFDHPAEISKIFRRYFPEL
jgi:archaeoflavoprotein AfpA